MSIYIVDFYIFLNSCTPSMMEENISLKGLQLACYLLSGH